MREKQNNTYAYESLLKSQKTFKRDIGEIFQATENHTYMVIKGDCRDCCFLNDRKWCSLNSTERKIMGNCEGIAFKKTTKKNITKEMILIGV